jgi:hypothetical protein
MWVIKSRRMRWVGHVIRIVERRDAYMVLVGRPEGKRPLGIPRHNWEDVILKWVFKKWEGGGGMD